MTNREKLIEFLRQSPGSYYCERCLGRLADVSNPHQVNLNIRPLAAGGVLHRTAEPCCHCGRYKKCVAYIPS